MADSRKKFKAPPKRFQPKGMTFLYEDRDLIVIDKVSGLLSVSSEKVKENTAYFLLNNYVRKGDLKSRKKAFIVHRLDRDTSGVIVFAKEESGKNFLQKEWSNFNKTYYAVVKGIPEQKEGILTSYLAENSAHKVYSVASAKLGKLAQTAYRVVKSGRGNSLLEIQLLTGRKNQIRVQLADEGHYVLGDKRYGEKEKGIHRLALHSASLTLRHPFSKEEMTFETPIPNEFHAWVKPYG